MKAPKPVDGGTRAPGCVVKGCGNQPARGAIICTPHARALQEPLPAPAHGITPTGPVPPAHGQHGGPAGTPGRTRPAARGGRSTGARERR